MRALERYRGKHFLLKGNAAVHHMTSFVMVWISVPVSVIATKVGTPKPRLEREYPPKS